MGREERRERSAVATGEIQLWLDQSMTLHLPLGEQETCQGANTATVW